jgi:hypothetical protein
MSPIPGTWQTPPGSWVWAGVTSEVSLTWEAGAAGEAGAAWAGLEV